METQDVDTLTNFTTNPSPFLDKLRQSGQRLVLTVEGKAELVVQDASSYLAMVDRMETIAAVKQGVQEMAAGKGRPMREVMEQIAKKFKLQTSR
jgi:hypothetical protein